MLKNKRKLNNRKFDEFPSSGSKRRRHTHMPSTSTSSDRSDYSEAKNKGWRKSDGYFSSNNRIYNEEIDSGSAEMATMGLTSDGKVRNVNNERDDTFDDLGNDVSDNDRGETESDSSDENDSEAEKSDEDAEANEDEDEYAAIKRELANIPLEDLMKLKEKVGLKAFNKIVHGGSQTSDAKKKQTVFKRANKNRPMEMSSKKPVPILRNMTVPKEKVRRDPRFDDLSGEYSEDHFSRNYSFITDIKSKEIQLLEKKISKTKNEDKKKSLQQLLTKMKQKEQADAAKKKKQDLESTWKHKEKELIKEGKTPYFLKKADKKKLELAEKFKELQKSGKMDQYLSKRRKKNAQKERKKLPNQHMKFS